MRTTLTVPARDLRVGDIVVDEHGDREHAVFDCEHVGLPTDTRVAIYTALSDQQFGWPASYAVGGNTPFTVTRAI